MAPQADPPIRWRRVGLQRRTHGGRHQSFPFLSCRTQAYGRHRAPATCSGGWESLQVREGVGEADEAAVAVELPAVHAGVACGEDGVGVDGKAEEGAEEHGDSAAVRDEEESVDVG